GAPIPIIYCDSCGIVPVPEQDLPVLLPYNVDFTPDGKSPLAKSESFINTTCPKCGQPARREADTLDTFVCSSWYFLRYPDNRNSDAPFNSDLINKMLPVDMYVGGPEHACMHLLYARFITKALRDMGYINFHEPFSALVHQGIILGPDGQRMSKSKGNVISPDFYVDTYGADVFRLHLMFSYNYTEGGPWSDDGIKAIVKFIDRIERIIDRTLNSKVSVRKSVGVSERKVLYSLHRAIQGITKDAEEFQFNTCISKLMELLNALYRYEQEDSVNYGFVKEILETLIMLLAPFAPHFCQEQWQSLGHSTYVHQKKWPIVDPSALVQDVIEIAVQVNGKMRDKINISSEADEDEIKNAATALPKVAEVLAGKNVDKIIVIKGRLVNIVVK
ncbi:MAG: class I tRNA ligase family protein, partial [bacterium]|nr:class I tRNA ligase family protein [bacterium]